MRNLTSLAEVVQHVRLCMCSALEEASVAIDGQPGCPCRSCTIPGSDVPWECPECGSGEPGQLTVTVNRLFVSTNFPLQNTAVDLCEPFTYVADLTVTLLRCIPVIDDRGNSPSCDRLERAAEIQHLDMMALMRAAECCVPHRPGRRRRTRVAVVQQRSIGSDGGCAGSELQLFVDVGGPCGCGGSE